jgi:hypothetical protein
LTPQVITPVPLDAKEQENKRWHQAQKFRQIMNQLSLLLDGIDDAELQDRIHTAIHELRVTFDRLVPEDHEIGRKRAKRRGE